ncbi:MAG: DUF5011 domain-containing protein [Firmicutes bacterium]|nr:DUF5011 domain-containing protein [Bacillota bacterium]
MPEIAGDDLIRSAEENDTKQENKASKGGPKAKRLRVLAAVLVFVLLAALVLGIVINVRPSVKMEAGSVPPRIEAFVRYNAKNYSFISDLSALDSTRPGPVAVRISGSLFNYTSELIIEDTVPPEGSTRSVLWPMGKELTADEFIGKTQDVTAVSVSFSKEPDLSSAGEKDVEILLEDEGGNRTVLNAKLTLVDDKEPPRIEGVRNRTLYVGENIAYKEGVTVTDDYDPSPRLTIDNSQVDLDKVGTYPVTYTATDFAGNSTVLSINLKVDAVPYGYDHIEDLYALTDEILAKIITDDMTDIEKLFAMFKWIRTNVAFMDTNLDRLDYVNEAIRCLKGRPSECYACAAGFMALAERAGFETMIVKRYRTYVKHYWNLVKVDGNWYHFDTTPQLARTYICFMATDDEVAAFQSYERNYYRFNRDDYPATPKTSPASVEYRGGQFYLILGEHPAGPET